MSLSLNHQSYPIAGIILDMDGLLIDSESTYCEAWMEASRNLNAPMTVEFCTSLFGQDAASVMRAFQDHLGGEEEVMGFMREATQVWHQSVQNNGIRPMPGAMELLDRLRVLDIPFMVATNSESKFAEIGLRQSGLDTLITRYLSRDEVRFGKPAPDLFLRAAELMNIKPEACWVLEDSLTGLKAAKAAGCWSVMIQSDPKRQTQGQHLAHVCLKDLTAFTHFFLDSQEEHAI